MSRGTVDMPLRLDGASATHIPTAPTAAIFD